MSRGVPLPRLGSPKDLVLRGLLQREWAARATELGLLSRLLGAVAGANQNNVDVALELYFQEITQARYGPLGEELGKRALERLHVVGDTPESELRDRLKRIEALNSTS